MRILARMRARGIAAALAGVLVANAAPSAVALLATVAAAPLAAAQQPAAQQTGYTFGDLFASVRSGVAVSGLEATRPASAKHLVDLERYFTGAETMGLSLEQLGKLYSPGPRDIAIVSRWNRRQVGGVALPGFTDSLTTLNRLIHSELEPALQAKLAGDSLDRLFKPVDELGTIILRNARDANQEKLRRLSAKYGPGSPQLNVVEVALNYIAQLKSPVFSPSPDGWTSPYEIVATYRSTDLTGSKAASKTGTDTTFRAHVVTTAQLGVRKYNFAPNCGTGHRLSELINPCQSSFGAFLMGPTDSPLLSPLALSTRGGVYHTRGKYHFAGVVFGPGKRFVFGLDQQVLPYIF